MRRATVITKNCDLCGEELEKIRTARLIIDNRLNYDEETFHFLYCKNCHKKVLKAFQKWEKGNLEENFTFLG
jgi:uncharacterized protein with PIN domain